MGIAHCADNLEGTVKKQIQNVYQNIIQHYLKPSPLKKSDWLSRFVEGDVYLKLESSNPNGSFKVRGALNAVSTLLAKHQDSSTEILKVAAL